jgi:hypothetical protein
VNREKRGYICGESSIKVIDVTTFWNGCFSCRFYYQPRKAKKYLTSESNDAKIVSSREES